MGNQLSDAFCRRKSRQVHVLILGLYAAGKTRLLYQYVQGRHVHTLPSLIDNIETCKLNRSELTILDVGNRMKNRIFLRHHYSHLKGLVFVVDSTNRERVGAAKEYLEEFLNEDELKDVPIAIALHKRDLDNCMTKEELEEILEVNTIQKQRPCRVFLTTTFPKDEEAQVNIKNLLEWIDEGPTIQTQDQFKQKGDTFSYVWGSLIKMKNVMFE